MKKIKINKKQKNEANQTETKEETNDKSTIEEVMAEPPTIPETFLTYYPLQ
jgi:hypothetical protein